MDSEPARQSGSEKPWLLKRMDQAALAVVNLAALAAIAGYWIVQGGLSGRLIEVDRQLPQTARFQLDVNQAEWAEWAQLPEIGETLARRIVETRRDNGPFRDIDDLRRVRGIGRVTLERIRPYLKPLPGADDIAAKEPVPKDVSISN